MNRFTWLLTAVLGTGVTLQPAVMAAKFEPKVTSLAQDTTIKVRLQRSSVARGYGRQD